MLLRIAFISSVMIFGPVEAAFAEPDMNNGRSLARSQCARCHGQDGNARSTRFQPVPMLAGQPAIYLMQEMRNYAEGTREDKSAGATMSRMLKQLSEQEWEDLAAFYEAQKRY